MPEALPAKVSFDAALLEREREGEREREREREEKLIRREGRRGRGEGIKVSRP